MRATPPTWFRPVDDIEGSSITQGSRRFNGSALSYRYGPDRWDRMAGSRFTPRRSTIGLVVVLLVVGATTALVLDVMTTAGARHRASDTLLFDREEIVLAPSRPTAGFRLQPAALRSDRAASGCVMVTLTEDGARAGIVRLHADGDSDGDGDGDGDDGVRLLLSLQDSCPDQATDTSADPTEPRFDERLSTLIDRHPDFDRGLELFRPDTGATSEHRSVAVVATATVTGDPDLEALAGTTLTVELGPFDPGVDKEDGEQPVG